MFDIPQVKVWHSCGHFIGTFEPHVRWSEGHRVHKATRPYGGVTMICPACSRRFVLSSDEMATPGQYGDKNDDGTWSMDVQTDGLPVPEILLIDAMVVLKASKSKDAARRRIRAGEVSINGKKVTDVDEIVPPYSGEMLKVGKKNYDL